MLQYQIVVMCRHYENHLEADEEEALPRFLNAARRIPPPSIAESSTMTKRSRRIEMANRDMINTDDALAAAEGDEDGKLTLFCVI